MENSVGTNQNDVPRLNDTRRDSRANQGSGPREVNVSGMVTRIFLGAGGDGPRCSWSELEQLLPFS